MAKTLGPALRWVFARPKPSAQAGSPGNSFLHEATKRSLDLLVGGVGLVFFAPAMGALACLIRLSSPGPVLIRQLRVGRGGKEFPMLKFRTMKAGSDKALTEALRNDPELRLTWQQYQKLLDDPRLTPLGRRLRRLSLDELPQLWNVVRGEMSLVGPRPFLPEQRVFYGSVYDEYVKVRPGVTGLWQVRGRNRLSFEERVALDEQYLRHQSLVQDLHILIRTLGAVTRATGAF